MNEPEVRRCGSCGAVAAVCDREWQHTTMGISTGSATRDFCCQACGKRFELAPMRRVYTFTALAVLFSWTCVMGVVGGAMALASYWPYLRNPVVPGAPRPPVRFTATEPIRECAACKGVARCTKVTRSTTRGIPTGTTFEYACTACKRTFTTASIGGHLFNAFGAVFLFAFGTGCMPVGLIFWLMALGISALSAFQVLAELRNPLIAEDLGPTPPA